MSPCNATSGDPHSPSIPEGFLQVWTACQRCVVPLLRGDSASTPAENQWCCSLWAPLLARSQEVKQQRKHQRVTRTRLEEELGVPPPRRLFTSVNIRWSNKWTLECETPAQEHVRHPELLSCGQHVSTVGLWTLEGVQRVKATATELLWTACVHRGSLDEEEASESNTHPSASCCVLHLLCHQQPTAAAQTHQELLHLEVIFSYGPYGAPSPHHE